MSHLPNQPSKSVVARNPHLYSKTPDLILDSGTKVFAPIHGKSSQKPLLNKTETRYRDLLLSQGITPLEQAVTLRLEWPYKSYRADLAYVDSRGGLVLVECKAKHRFFEKGVAKVCLAAKVYPQFRFILAVWECNRFKETVLPS